MKEGGLLWSPDRKGSERVSGANLPNSYICFSAGLHQLRVLKSMPITVRLPRQPCITGFLRTFHSHFYPCPSILRPFQQSRIRFVQGEERKGHPFGFLHNNVFFSSLTKHGFTSSVTLSLSLLAIANSLLPVFFLLVLLLAVRSAFANVVVLNLTELVHPPSFFLSSSFLPL